MGECDTLEIVYTIINNNIVKTVPNTFLMFIKHIFNNKHALRQHELSTAECASSYHRKCCNGNIVTSTVVGKTAAKKSLIFPCRLKLVFRNDEKLDKHLYGVTVVHGRVLPNNQAVSLAGKSEIMLGNNSLQKAAHLRATSYILGQGVIATHY